MRNCVILLFLFISSASQSAGAARGSWSRPRQETAYWVQGFEVCSASCGGGFQRTFPQCWMSEVQVSDFNCDPSTRPEPENRPCAQEPCAKPGWRLSDWSSCSAKCGPGWRRRVARCVFKISAYNYREVEERMCSSLPRPPDELGKCSSGVSVPCPPFASRDVDCFSPPCRTVAGPDSDTDTGGGGDATNLRPASAPLWLPACLLLRTFTSLIWDTTNNI